MPQLNPTVRLGMALFIVLLVGTIVAYHAFLERYLERNERKKARPEAGHGQRNRDPGAF
jgi:membrane protein implicated in regulation of membrane protease activity